MFIEYEKQSQPWTLLWFQMSVLQVYFAAAVDLNLIGLKRHDLKYEVVK